MPIESMDHRRKIIDVSTIAKSERGQNYFPELDALRTFAVALTLITHFFPFAGWVEIPYTWYGVDVFFSISGFLITLGLLRDKSSKLPNITLIKHFFVKRALRLFPPYYLLLLLFFLGKQSGHILIWKDEYTAYFFTYTANIYYYLHGMANSPVFVHLWSLSVEEQFYLIWPWLILLFKRKKVLIVICLFVLVGIFSHLFVNLGDPRLLTFGDFHTLGGGAFIAYLFHFHKQSAFFKFLIQRRHLLVVVSFVTLFFALTYGSSIGFTLQILRQIALMCTTSSLVLISIQGWGNPINKLTRNNTVRYLGQISYGIYLYHLPVVYVCATVLNIYSIKTLNSILMIFIWVSLTLIVSALSYHFFERPILKFKNQLFRSTRNFPRMDS